MTRKKKEKKNIEPKAEEVQADEKKKLGSGWDKVEPAKEFFGGSK